MIIFHTFIVNVLICVRLHLKPMHTICCTFIVYPIFVSYSYLVLFITHVSTTMCICAKNVSNHDHIEALQRMGPSFDGCKFASHVSACLCFEKKLFPKSLKNQRCIIWKLHLGMMWAFPQISSRNSFETCSLESILRSWVWDIREG